MLGHDRRHLREKVERADQQERQGRLSDGPHTGAKAPLWDHGCSRRPGAARTEKEIMIVAIYLKTPTDQTDVSM